MTRSVPPPEVDGLGGAVRWCAVLAVTLAEASARAATLADRIVHDWLDDHGREWAERTAMLHRELGRDALAAAELGNLVACRAAETSGTDLYPAVLAPGRRGPRLGGTEASRADDERGMRLAQLPDLDAPG